MIYGSLPTNLGFIDLSPTEMMFWLYCPIKVPGWQISLPAQLEQFRPIVKEVVGDIFRSQQLKLLESHYAYLTVKTLWVSGEYIGNRPGWHCDGFGTDDINYIWSDRAPTEFLHIPDGITLSEDCTESMRQMHCYGLRPAMYGGGIVDFPDKHLLRLDQSVIHRSPTRFEPGMRTFVKVSFSKDRYDLVGNSINHDLPASHWPLVERRAERNHPQSSMS